MAAREFNYLGQTLKTTVSAGIASRRSEMLCCADLLSEADGALYKAKRAGRNMVQRGRDLPGNTQTASNPAA